MYALLIAVIATVIPTFLMAEGIKHIGSNNMSILASIGPVTTIILSTIILDEPFTVYHFIGAILVLSGVILIGKATGKKTAQSV
jgi:drug/metabolite transporter (DMT)-like permease